MLKLRVLAGVLLFFGLVAASVHLSSATTPVISSEPSTSHPRSVEPRDDESDVLSDWDFTSRSRDDDDRCRAG